MTNKAIQESSNDKEVKAAEVTTPGDWQTIDTTDFDSIIDTLDTLSLGSVRFDKSIPTTTKASHRQPHPKLEHDNKTTSTSKKNCRSCLEPAVKRTVLPDNENGNASRPYFVCVNEECVITIRTGKRGYDGGWVAWGDQKGVEESNPKCYCDEPSRLDKICKNDDGKKGLGFWTCADGDCDYHSQDVDGLPGWAAKLTPFRPEEL